MDIHSDEEADLNEDTSFVYVVEAKPDELLRTNKRKIIEEDPLETASDRGSAAASQQKLLNKYINRGPTPIERIEKNPNAIKTYSKRSKQFEKIKLQYVCDICKLIVSSAELLESHKVQVHGATPSQIVLNHYALGNFTQRFVEAPLNDTKCKSKKHSCNICYSQFDNDDALINHKNESHLVPNAYACHLCDAKFDTDVLAKKHIYGEHPVAGFARKGKF